MPKCSAIDLAEIRPEVFQDQLVNLINNFRGGHRCVSDELYILFHFRNSYMLTKKEYKAKGWYEPADGRDSEGYSWPRKDLHVTQKV
jgi:hypothetical protein